jgi:hypothetical protein
MDKEQCGISGAGLFYLPVVFLHMFNEEIKKLLIQVISSWQVLTVTAILVIYIFIVNHVARIYHRPRSSGKQPKVKPAAPAASAEHDELGLEEGTAEKQQ